MRHLVLPLFLALASPAPAVAQPDEGSSMMEEGMQQFLEGLLREMEPAFEDMREFLDQMGPALNDILDDVQDWSVYEPPEVLENGDIIIRRKPEKDVPQVKPERDDPQQTEI